MVRKLMVRELSLIVRVNIVLNRTVEITEKYYKRTALVFSLNNLCLSILTGLGLRDWTFHGLSSN